MLERSLMLQVPQLIAKRLARQNTLEPRRIDRSRLERLINPIEDARDRDEESRFKECEVLKEAKVVAARVADPSARGKADVFDETLVDVAELWRKGLVPFGVMGRRGARGGRRRGFRRLRRRSRGGYRSWRRREARE